jgi:hypothetical protein
LSASKTPLDRKGAAFIKYGVLTPKRNPDWSGPPDSNRRFQLVRYQPLDGVLPSSLQAPSARLAECGGSTRAKRYPAVEPTLRAYVSRDRAAPAASGVNPLSNIPSGKRVFCAFPANGFTNAGDRPAHNASLMDCRKRTVLMSLATERALALESVDRTPAPMGVCDGKRQPLRRIYLPSRL